MIYAKLTDFEPIGLASLGKTVFGPVAWVRDLPTDLTDVRHALDGDGLYTVVMRYVTVSAGESHFETHRKYVDLQYTLAGSEIIEWAPRGALAKDGDDDAE